MKNAYSSHCWPDFDYLPTKLYDLFFQSQRINPWASSPQYYQLRLGEPLNLIEFHMSYLNISFSIPVVQSCRLSEAIFIHTKPH